MGQKTKYTTVKAAKGKKTKIEHRSVLEKAGVAIRIRDKVKFKIKRTKRGKDKL